MPELPGPRVGWGRARGSGKRGFSERGHCANSSFVSGFLVVVEGSSRGVMREKQRGKKATSAEWTIFHGDVIQ